MVKAKDIQIRDPFVLGENSQCGVLAMLVSAPYRKYNVDTQEYRGRWFESNLGSHS